MGCFFNIIYVNGWFRKGYIMTIEKLYNRILSECKSYDNWITSATELVSIMKEKNIPKEYARGFKICILNCFADLETKREFPSRRLSSDDKAAYYCYNTLDSSSDKEAFETKKRYFTAILDGIIKYESNKFSISMRTGETYKKVCKEWKKSMFSLLFREYDINFRELREILKCSFFDIIIKSKKSGEFEADEKKHWEDFFNFARNLLEDE